MTAPAPLVSIVLPTRNGARYLAQSIESCLAQSYQALELIVVDGGSTDETLAIVQRYEQRDSRVRLVHQGNNANGLPGALNLGFQHAAGELFSWAQADDYYAPNAFAVMVQALQAQPEIGLVYAGFDFVEADGKFLRAATLGPPEGLRHTNVVGHCFLYPRAVAAQVGEYDPAYLMSEDLHYWLRAYQRTHLLYLPGTYYAHRLHADSLTMRDYGRYWALRVAARARRAVLRISWREYARQVAASYIEEAFAAHAQHDARQVRRCLVRGLPLDPRWLGNRGLWSIGVQSALGYRPAGPRG
jgi:glycosyltransferase involved in cell wall biosynthesis